MKFIIFCCSIISILICNTASNTWAQQTGSNKISSLKTSYSDISWPVVGQIKKRDATAIHASRWSIGGETLDRDYANYDAYKKYLGPLGAKRIRLQGGWAKTEKQKGSYNWSWLDSIVTDAVHQGVKPWIETSYGNPIYEGGGDARIGGGIPSSPQALQAWDHWVTELVRRYKNKVDEWEIWNEPNGSHKYDAEAYAAFFIRTASVIRREQPKAKIIALALAGVSTSSLEYTKTFLSYLSSHNKLSLVDIISYHIYPRRPETAFQDFERLKATAETFSKSISFWQGETGCPSTASVASSGALSHFDWTEVSQAKWVLRRMFDQMKHSDEIAITSIFQISDMNGYNGGKNNTKGLLKTNQDNSIEYAKPSYYAMQHVTALFDNTIQVNPDFQAKVSVQDTVESVGFTKNGKGIQGFSIWYSGRPPSSSQIIKYATITVPYKKFVNPVYVNMLSGKIYKIPQSNYSKSGNSYIFRDIPIYDFPIVIVNAGFLLNP